MLNIFGWLLSKVSAFLWSLGMASVKDYYFGMVAIKGFCLFVVFGAGLQSMIMVCEVVLPLCCLLEMAAEDCYFRGGCCQRFLPFCCLWGWFQSKIIILGWLPSKVSVFRLSLELGCSQ